MRQALRRAGPAVFASGSTVILALLCLSLAQVNGTSGLGPIGAMGVALAMLAMLTLLPAALVAGGRRAFWPFIPRFGSEGTDETHGAWRRVGERVAAAPRPVWITAALLLGLGCLGLTSFSTGLTNTQDFRGRVQSVEGQRLIAKAFPAGANAPTDVVVRDVGAVPRVQRALCPHAHRRPLLDPSREPGPAPSRGGPRGQPDRARGRPDRAAEGLRHR